MGKINFEQYKSALECYKFSLFKNTFATSKEKDISLYNLLKLTTEQNDISRQVIKLRSIKDTETAKKEKMKLPCVTLSGVFSERQDNAIVEHSNLLQIDIDKPNNLIELHNKLQQDKHIFVSFISPSSTGLKCIVKIIGKRHLEYFLAYQSYFKKNYDVTIDKSCKNVSRLLYISHDNKPYINISAELLNIESIEPVKFGDNKTHSPLQTQSRENSFSSIHHPKTIDECWKFTLQNETYEEGNRDNFVYTFANVCNRASMNEIEVVNFALSNANGLTNAEIEKCVNSAYKNKSEHGKYANKELSEINTQTAMNQNNHSSMLTKNNENQSKVESHQPMIAQVENFLKKHFEFRKNVVLNVTEYREKNNPKSIFKPCNENSLSRFLQHSSFNYSPTKTGALIYSDFVQDYNPFIDFFNCLKPYEKDKEPNYIDNLCNYIKATDKERFRTNFYKMLLRSIHCSTVSTKSNDHFNKHVFVLYNARQSSGKSTFCKWLCPDELIEYYTQDFEVGNKDAVISLAQKFIINFDELAGLSKWDIGKLKSVISQPSVNLRHPFEKRTQSDARRANFVGSTNEKTFLHDDTGSVRWLIFEIESIDFDYKKNIDVKDIWRQAYSLYKQGYTGKLTTEEIKQNEEINKTFTVINSEYEVVATYFSNGTKEDKFYTASDIIKELAVNAGIATSKFNANQIGKVCARLGFTPVQKRNGVYPVKGYYLKYGNALDE